MNSILGSIPPMPTPTPVPLPRAQQATYAANSVRRRCTPDKKSLSVLSHIISVSAMALLLVPAASAQLTGTVDFTATQQQIDGFGLNATFGRGAVIDSATGNIPAQVADLLYNPVSGAGLSILRMGIDTDLIIVPNAPASCSETQPMSGITTMAARSGWVSRPSSTASSATTPTPGARPGT